MHYVLLICLLLGTLSHFGRAWECSPHLLIMQIAMTELTAEEQGKIKRILGGMTDSDADFTMLEAACFHEDMTASGFTGFEEFKSYETPLYDGISEHEAAFTKPMMDSLYAIVSSLAKLF